MKNKLKLIIMTCLLTLFFVNTVLADGWTTDGYDWYYQKEGMNVTATIQSSKGDKYYLGDDGKMVRDYLLEDYNNATYYFNDDGKMVFNTWVAVDPYQVSNPIENGPTIYLYYFGANGKAYRAKQDVVRKTIDGKKYLFNADGIMLTGWISETGYMSNIYDTDEDPFIGSIYYAGGETDGVLREGWMAYEDGSLDDNYYHKETIWFYFSLSSNKKVYYDGQGSQYDYIAKKINGKTYAFDENGVMLTAWEAEPATKYHLNNPSNQDEYGSLAKKRWVYDIPSEEINSDDYNDEVSRWFYSQPDGNLVKGQLKRINKNYYGFDKTGIMRDGLIIFNTDNTYVDTIDLDNTDGKQFIIDRKYISKETKQEKQFDDSTMKIYYFDTDETGSNYGVRKTGSVTVPFADKDYTFASDANGQYEGYKKKKQYQAGMLLSAEPTIGLGLVLDGYADKTNYTERSRDALYIGGTLGQGGNEYYAYYDFNDYAGSEVPHLIVVDANGRKHIKTNSVKKDKDGYFWVIGANSTFIKAVTVPVKYSGGKWFFKSDKYNSSNQRIQNDWIECFTEDKADAPLDSNQCKVIIARSQGNYEVQPNDMYSINFDWLS